jgi:hypothetical protein
MIAILGAFFTELERGVGGVGVGDVKVITRTASAVKKWKNDEPYFCLRDCLLSI